MDELAIRRQLEADFVQMQSSHERLSSQRGEYVTTAIEIEAVLDEIIADHFLLTASLRDDYLALVAQRLGFDAKIQNLRYILKRRTAMSPQEVNGFTKRLDDVRTFRNACAHVHPTKQPTSSGREVLHLVAYSRQGEPRPHRVDRRSMQKRLDNAHALRLEVAELRLGLLRDNDGAG